MRAALVLGLMLASASAHADDREEAHREFAAGQAADKQSDWQTAIEHYLRANELVPHPFAIYNIATDYERLGQLREAANWYERYLQAAPPDAPDRAKVTRTLADFKVRPGKVMIRTTPPGAKVAIDGTKVGVTPYSGVARGGTHHVTLDLNGQHDERDIAIEFAEPADLDVVLGTGSPEPPPAGVSILIVTGTPVGAYITIDGSAKGVMPATVPVSPGVHQIHVEAYGYTSYDTKATVGETQTQRVDVALPKALGGIDTTPKTQIGYVLGFSAGADAGGTGALYEAAFGARAMQYEGVIRLGSASGTTAIDFLLRWAFTSARVSPYLGLGYAYISQGFGYEAALGLRWDISRSDALGLSLLVDGGILYHSSTDSTSGMTSAGVAYPIAGSLEIVYR